MRKLFVSLTQSDGTPVEFTDVECFAFSKLGFFVIHKSDGEQEIYHPDKVLTLTVVPQ